MFIIYEQISGEIISQINIPNSDLDLNVKDGCGVIFSVLPLDNNVFYIDHETGKEIERLDYEYGEMPLPCVITIDNKTYNITEQPTFEFDAPGTYTIKVDAGPRYLKKEFTIAYQPQITESLSAR